MQSASSGRWIGPVRFIFLFAFLAIASRPQMASAAIKVVTDDDKGGDVQLKVGDLLEVRLKSNPSTGYMWYVHPKSTVLLRLSGQKQTDATEPGEARPIVQVFTFEVKRRGDGILLMRYVRAGEKPALGEEQFHLHLVIE